MGQPTLFLHIGAGKCGSSAIQQFLALNVDMLASAGVLVPGRELTPDPAGCAQHLAFFEDGIRRADFADELQDKLRALLAHVSTARLHSVVISAENLINPRSFDELFDAAKHLFDLRIVAYVRRQDDFVISAWQQWQLKRFGDFWEYYGPLRGSFDWHRQLEPWRNRYGRASMVVRRFTPTDLVGGDVVDDFAEIIGVNADEFDRSGPINRSVHERFNTLACNHRDELFESVNDHLFYRFLEEVLGDKALKDYRGSTLLTLSQRNMIVNDHATANARLRQVYFSELGEEPLFANPSPTDVHVLDEPPIDKATELLYVGMFRMWKQQTFDARPQEGTPLRGEP